ncbi:winged helix DNA-binding domain-containing protein [Micromonospora sp. PPF5-17]|uniref:Winged helix DNA-binding domain-containing protein n=2 Tax=Micromonosporaceae TaxID=28056 RepID=A0ABX9WN82_9ACTN|nr:winged helix DNA-binding domain-containing protein [Micromonospora sp. PPF5-17B]NES35224.1 winged helix DNA-binding domain-containing protein [Micromonospora solifontis]NES58394.1 winged helix DNA-binding domain-containing protein [Micromonospora sp. PPF5-6]RNM01047.1 winged helix DNA-binding domain-containing protein [Micromonospora solifontis]
MTSLLLRPHPVARPEGVADVVEWFGAMQAQDVASGEWSLGVRLPGRRRTDVRAALERREALRTWPMRGTVHLVPARDAHWMLAVTGVRTLAGAATRRAQLGLSESDADRAVDVLGDALAGGGRLTRAECLAALNAAGLDTGGQRGYHLLWYASQRGVTCIAPQVGKEQTFALLDEWVPDPRRPDREEALGLLALRYVRSHGPVTAHDLARWTGLTVTDARRGIAVAGDALAPVEVDGAAALVDAALLDAPREPVDDVHTLPGFDEYLLGFKDRTLMLDPAHAAAVVPGNNGVFQSTVVRGGRVVGIWKRTLGRERVAVRVRPLVPLDPATDARVGSALQAYARFLDLALDRVDD